MSSGTPFYCPEIQCRRPKWVVASINFWIQVPPLKCNAVVLFNPSFVGITIMNKSHHELDLWYWKGRCIYREAIALVTRRLRASSCFFSSSAELSVISRVAIASEMVCSIFSF